MCVAVALAGCLFAPLLNADIDARAIAINCLSCHTESGSSLSHPIPTLTDLSALQIQQALLGFKYDNKSATLMPRIVKGFNDDELQAVADYLARH